MDLINRQKSNQENPEFGQSLVENNYYQILGLSRYATDVQIRHSYFRIKNSYSSGNQAHYSLISEEERNQTLGSIERAFDVLSHTEKRQEYDEKLGYKSDKLHYETGGLNSSEATEYQDQAVDQIERLAPMRTAMEFKNEFDGLESSETSGSSVSAFRPISKKESGLIRRVAEKVGKESVKAQIEELIENAETIDGELLISLREAAGVQISELQNHTKISISLIGALESSNYQMLPQNTYVKGMLKNYLKFLGISDSTEFIASYVERAESCKTQK